MKDVITDREDVFLAKIAGQEIDISTMTPPVPNGVHELILAAIAERIDSIAQRCGSNE